MAGDLCLGTPPCATLPHRSCTCDWGIKWMVVSKSHSKSMPYFLKNTSTLLLPKNPVVSYAKLLKFMLLLTNSHTDKFRPQSLSFLLLLLLFTGQVLAGAPYLAPGHPDGVALLAPPPTTGSAEEAADLIAVRSAFQARTPTEKDRAMKAAGLSFSLFEPAVEPVFQPGTLPKTEAHFRKGLTQTVETIDIPKDHWKRKRPY